MPYSRQRPRIANTGKVTVRLSPEQRDLFVRSPHTSQGLGHLLHRAPVRNGELSARLTRAELEALIRAAAEVEVADKKQDRKIDALLRYLESLEDQFEDPVESA